MNVFPARKIATICVSMSILACLASGSRTVAAEKASALTLPETSARNSSIVSNTVAVVEIPASVFVDRPSGQDPFYPNASYRKQVSKTPAPNPGDGGDALLKTLKLTGFGGIGKKRWAMINGVSVYEGETSSVRIGSTLHQIVCLEMKEHSVIVGTKDNPAQRELKLDN
jgi:hypothetical protein